MEQFRRSLLQGLAHAHLMGGIGPGMDEANGGRFRPLRAQACDRRLYARLIKRDDNFAGGIEPFDDFMGIAARGQRFGPAEQEIVGFRPISTPDLIDVARALRHDQRRFGAGAFNRRVDRHRGPMHEIVEA